MSASIILFSDSSSCDRKLIWLIKGGINELKFLQQLEDSWMHIGTKFHSYWTSGMRDMNFSPRKTESKNSLYGIGLHQNNKVKVALKIGHEESVKMRCISLVQRSCNQITSNK